MSDGPETRTEPHGAGRRQPGFLGHPVQLLTLSFTEMWERFSYYGMRALLVLYMVAPPEQGGLGFNPGHAGAIYGLYTSLVYLAATPGGWIADTYLGLRLAILIGAVTIAAGHFVMLLPGLAAFYLGMGLIIAGTGFLKPTVSSMVGLFYGEGESARRDAGYSIFRRSPSAWRSSSWAPAPWPCCCASRSSASCTVAGR